MELCDSQMMFSRQNRHELIPLNWLQEGKTYDGDGIREEDIGIISPYRRQVLKIRGVLAERGYTKVTIGSTEEFQGQERLIMLLSTVRSDAAQAFDSLKGQTLGFLRNEKVTLSFIRIPLPICPT